MPARVAGIFFNKSEKEIMWYGIKIYAEIVWVEWFLLPPNIEDFHYPNKEDHRPKEIVKVYIREEYEYEPKPCCRT